MKKIFVLTPGENWICDRQVAEFVDSNKDICVTNPYDADVIWLMADWCVDKLPFALLTDKTVVTTIHHIVPEKFDEKAQHTFRMRDRVTNVYHVPNIHTHNFVEQYTTKPIVQIPYWANQSIWHRDFIHEDAKTVLRDKYKIPRDKFIVGSFQRDSEGSDVTKPKLEKGPDLLADFLIEKNKSCDVHVVLAGWRRQYIIKRLNDAKIPFTYIELPEQPVINELYQTLDLYPVTARYEGGPQAFLECMLLNVPMVSRSVGMAEQILSPSAINDDVSKATAEIPKQLKSLHMNEGFLPYLHLLFRV